jgi:hypothetical protein
MHSDTGTNIDALEDICNPIYAVVYAKQNVYVLRIYYEYHFNLYSHEAIDC